MFLKKISLDFVDSFKTEIWRKCLKACILSSWEVFCQFPKQRINSNEHQLPHPWTSWLSRNCSCVPAAKAVEKRSCQRSSNVWPGWHLQYLQSLLKVWCAYGQESKVTNRHGEWHSEKWNLWLRMFSWNHFGVCFNSLNSKVKSRLKCSPSIV